jgi:hypothetical protein
MVLCIKLIILAILIFVLNNLTAYSSKRNLRINKQEEINNYSASIKNKQLLNHYFDHYNMNVKPTLVDHKINNKSIKKNLK